MKARGDVAGLVKATRHREPFWRQAACRALNTFHQGESIAALIEALKDNASDVRAAAALSLGELGAKQAVDSLITTLNDPVMSPRLHTAYALGKIADPRAISALITALCDEEHFPWLGNSAVPLKNIPAYALVQIGSAAVEALTNTLQNPSLGVRISVVGALGLIRDRNAVDALITALGDQDESIVAEAAEALGEIGDTRALPALEHLASSSRSYPGPDSRSCSAAKVAIYRIQRGY